MIGKCQKGAILHCPFREAQEKYQTPRSTLSKIILKSKKETPTEGQIYNIQSSGYNHISTCRMILTEEQECMLSNHIKALERLYGLSVNQSCELAHECTAQNKPAIPVSWKKYRSAGDPNTVLDY